MFIELTVIQVKYVVLTQSKMRLIVLTTNGNCIIIYTDGNKCEEMMRIHVGFIIIWFLFVIKQDIKTYKISNRYIAVGLLVGLIIRVYEQGIYGLLMWGIGILAPVVILFPLSMIRVFGAGDVKVFAVLGGYFSYEYAIRCMIISVLFGAILAVVKLIQTNSYSQRIQYFFSYVSQVMYSKKVIPYYNPERDGRDCVIHYSIAIFCSVLWCVLSGILY